MQSNQTQELRTLQALLKNLLHSIALTSAALSLPMARHVIKDNPEFSLREDGSLVPKIKASLFDIALALDAASKDDISRCDLQDGGES